MSSINNGIRGRLTKLFGGSQLDTLITGNYNRIEALEKNLKSKSSLSSQILDLIDTQQKTQTLINPISYRQTYSTSGGEVITFPPEAYDFFINNMLGNSTARPMLQARKQELTRNGLELKAVFQSKCPVCSIDYDQIVEECDECGNTEEDNAFILPDEKEKEFAEEWIKEDFKVNNNRQNLYDLIEMTLEFTDIVDDGWWVVENEYIHHNGYIISTTPQELWVIHPANIAWSVDRYNKIGKYEWTCVDHRQFIARNHDTLCDVDGCGNITYPVIAVRYHPGTQTIIQRYISNEILHGSLHRPSALNGYPPAITLQYELSLTTNQMKYMSDYYDDVNYHKTPGYLLLPTMKDWETVWKETKRMRKELQMDPFAIGVLPYSPDGTAKPEFVRFDTTPREMEFIPTRDEARGRMSAFYGVSPIMQADVSAGGGLNNEGLQFTVTNRAVSKAQQYINRNFLTPVSNLLNLNDWVIRLAPNEEQDKVAELDYKIKVANYAEVMLRLGYDNKLDSNHDLQIIAKKMEQQSDPYEEMFNQGYEISDTDEPAQLENKEDKSSDGYQGAPETPDVGFKKMKEPYKFNETYPDWEWKDDYELVEFRIIHLSEIKSHPDFEIKEEDIENGSPRVRAGTIIYYLSEATEMDALIMDINYNLLDGNHRKYVLDKRKQEMITAAIVKPKNKEIEKVLLSDEIPETKVKAQLRAPKGGVNIKGKFYPGGKFIPKDVIEDMSEDEKKAVEEGKDSGAVDSVEDNGKKKPESLNPKDIVLDKISKGEIIKEPKEMDIIIKENIIRKYSKFERGEQKGEFYTSLLQLEDGETKENFIERMRNFERYLLEKGDITQGYDTKSSKTKIDDTEFNDIKQSLSRLPFKLNSKSKIYLRKWYYENTTFEQRRKHLTGNLEIAPSLEAFKENPDKYSIPGINDSLPENFTIKNDFEKGYIYLKYNDKLVGQISIEAYEESDENIENMRDRWENSKQYSDEYQKWVDDTMEDVIDFYEFDEIYEEHEQYEWDQQHWLNTVSDETKTYWEDNNYSEDEIKDEFRETDEYKSYAKEFVKNWSEDIIEPLEAGGFRFDDDDSLFNEWADMNRLRGSASDTYSIGVGEINPKLRGMGLYSFLRRDLFQYADEHDFNIETEAAPTHYMNRFISDNSNKIYYDYKQNTIREYYASFGISEIINNFIMRSPQK